MARSTSARSGLSRWLETAPAPLFTAYGVGAAFCAYFCMYGFRKPFSVATFGGHVPVPWLGQLDLKTLYILAQVLGYCCSKFWGVKIVSEVPPERRALAILICIGVAQFALVLFGLLPGPYVALGMFLNGLPLGMIWGLIFGFLEGRRVSDSLGAGLCASFILASGFVKSVGRSVLDHGVSDHWMPACVGLLFAPPLALSVWLLAQIPPPSSTDEATQTKRAPMDSRARRAFFVQYAPGLVALIAAYVALTALRDFRDNFARELWDALGFGASPAILTTTEVPVAIGALGGVALMMVIRDNKRALLATHLLMASGALLIAGSTLLFQLGIVSALPWMIAVGLGLYLGFVPFNCVLFDRLIAATGSLATAGYLITLADAFGYLGSTAVLLGKSLGNPKLAWLPFFEGFAYAGSAVCLLCFAASALYFAKRLPKTNT
jgi:Family of unknown function (DUF5690)